MARLEEICSLITDGSHFSPEDEGVGYPMFSVKDMTPNGFNISGYKKIGEEAYKKLVANGCKPLNDDVVVAKDGSYLKTALDRKSTRLNSSHRLESRMPSSA